MESSKKTVIRPTLEEANQWKEGEWRESNGFLVEVPCVHRNCKMTKTIPCHSPTQLRYAQRSANQEKWYCHHHKLAAWENDREISSDLLPYLQALNEAPGCNKAKLGCKQRDINFLLAIGLISVDTVPLGTKIGYEIELTEQGEQYLEERAKQLAAHMKNQPTRAQLEYYVP